MFSDLPGVNYWLFCVLRQVLIVANFVFNQQLKLCSWEKGPYNFSSRNEFASLNNRFRLKIHLTCARTYGRRGRMDVTASLIGILPLRDVVYWDVADCAYWFQCQVRGACMARNRIYEQLFDFRPTAIAQLFQSSIWLEWPDETIKSVSLTNH